MDVEERLSNVLKNRLSVQPLDLVWVAFSGGMDSTVLLHSAARVICPLGIQLRAIHVDHGIHSLSASWAEHCAAVCESLSIPLESVCVNMKLEKGASLEQQAREARYRVFRTVIQSGEVLFTAHHERDQAETLLVQLFRGAGPKGLSAMPEFSSLGQGELIRPFLDLSHSALTEYAYERQLVWIDDPSNESTDITRNFVRHDVLPVLEERWPTIARSVSRSARHCAEATEIQDTMAQIDLGILSSVELGHRIELQTLADLVIARRKNAIRYWIRSVGLRLPSSVKLDDIDRQLFFGTEDSLPCIKWSGGVLRRYRKAAYISTEEVLERSVSSIDWDLQASPGLDLPMGRLTARPRKGKGVSDDWILAECGEVSVKFRVGGERVQYRVGLHKSLNKVFQELGVPPWLRDFVPLIFAKDELVAIAGYCVFKPYATRPEAIGTEIYFKGKPGLGLPT